MRASIRRIPPSLLLVFVTFGAGILCPIFEDEIAYRMMHSRLFLDGGMAFTLFPQCFPPDWQHSVSALAYPYKALESLFYNAFDTPLILRIAGILKAMLLACVGFAVLSRFLEDGAEKNSRAVGLFLLLAFGLGVGPFLFVINRPEQELLLGIFFTILLLQRPAPLHRSVPRDAFLSLGFLVALLFVITPHPNALFFLPLWLLAAWQLPHRRSLKASSVLGVGVMAFDRAVAEAQADLCPRDPEMLRRIHAAALRPGDLFTDPGHFFSSVFDSLVRFPEYVRGLQFSGIYPYGWAPFHPLTMFHSGGNLLLAVACFALLLAALAGAAFLGLEAWQRRSMRPRVWILLALAASWSALVLLQLRKNWYSASLVWPVLALLAALGWPSLGRRLGARARAAFGYGGGAVCAVSLLLFWWSFVVEYPPLLRAPGANVKGALSFSAFGYGEVTERIREIARQCGIDPEHPPKRLAVDALTYWALRKSEAPIEISYVSRNYRHDPSYQHTIGTLSNFLQDRGSMAIVSRCDEVIESALWPRVSASGKFCCWSLGVLR